MQEQLWHYRSNQYQLRLKYIRLSDLLKAGRVKSSDTIDHSIGLSGVVQIGQFVSAGDPLAIAQVRHLNDIDYLKEELSNAINITEDIPPNGPGSENELIYDILNPNPS